MTAEQAPVENHMMFFRQLVSIELWLLQLQQTPVTAPSPARASIPG